MKESGLDHKKRYKGATGGSKGKSVPSQMDLEFDEKCGRICTLIVPSPGKLCNLFFHDCEYWIPWRCVRSIGKDIILVEVNEKEMSDNYPIFIDNYVEKKI